MSGRPKGELVLSDSEREDLQALTMRRKTAQALALRARFVIHRVDGLLDAPRPGTPRTIDDARVDALIAKTLESVPVGATHWSTRTMAREMKLSQTAVTRIWRAFGLQPHRQETFKLSAHHRSQRAVLPGGASDNGQLWYAQDALDQSLVRSSSSLPCSLHTHLGVVA